MTSLYPSDWELAPKTTAKVTAEAGSFLPYGGADFSSVVDAAGHLFFAAFAKPPNGEYAFYIFKDGVPLPLSPRPIGRGQIQPQFRVVGGLLTISYTYIAGTNGVPQRGDVPQFQAFTVGGGGGSAPITIPATSPLWQVYTGEYKSDAELQSAPGLFVRFNKLKDGLLSLVHELMAAGVIVRGK